MIDFINQNIWTDLKMNSIKTSRMNKDYNSSTVGDDDAVVKVTEIIT